MDQQTKRCFQCSRERPVGEFRRDAAFPDGRRSRCRECCSLPPLTRGERFWLLAARGGEDECWPWTGCATHGHGQVRWGGRTEYAHRVAWSLANGPIPDGEQVLHSCDNPPCVNPRHLFLGSQLDNVADMMAKGRRADTRGSACPTAKLDERAVSEIRRALRGGATPEELALRHGVDEWTVRDVRDRRTWRHVP